MKSFLTIVFFLFYTVANCQPTGTDVIHFKSPKMVQYVAENFLQGNQKIIYTADLGFNADIYIDRLLKSYSIYMTIPDGERKIAKFEYLSDYYVNGKRQDNMFVLTMNKERFIVWDMCDMPSPLNQLYFILEEPYAPKQTRFLLLTQIEK